MGVGASMSNYRIRPNDTLSGLAARFGTTVEKLARDNNITNPDLIYAGNTLRIGHSGRDSFDAGGGRQGVRGGGPSGGVSGGADVGGPTGAGPSNASDAMRRLADAARSAAMGMGGYNSQGLCATGVSRAIRNSLGIGVSGNGNQIDNNLPRDKFKQVNMSLEEALKIPGLVLTWESTSTRLGSIYGHTAVTLGDGHSSASDFIERNTTNSGRTGFKVFMPIV
ncbi:LysM domain protein [Myxococcus xanthus DK 1622]|uniref:LysM domain protein n=2 Tax=Myxococcaceae TaxID=31 RepID=Q1D1T0_MYXXD|nr:LysM domain protein [Myxococcus xanthus DK 1622]NOJ53633.1 LysM peptidoglycan-binding domain-containing protein [Myxococcus xanthus]QPM77732.1 LysM peptidoglycan-binding domain-containing protein [Myxococcus xanthus]QVW66800.1 LysM peptidoglycan-binding domain-containing protein [Myxococcus xanthus DZ2]UEO07072.1 LysM peptidoglycan-binding domain-containing protein [Myxococcus xanthus DZ2]